MQMIERNEAILNAVRHYLKSIPIKDLDTLDKEFLEMGMKKFMITSYTRLDGLKVYTSLLTKRKYVNEKTLIHKIMLNKLARLSATVFSSSCNNHKYTDTTVVHKNIYETIKTILKDK